MNQPDCPLKPGTLLPTLIERIAHVHDRKEILTIPRELEMIEQSSVGFQVRVRKALALKVLATDSKLRADPLLSYDPSLFVTGITMTPIALLKKCYEAR